MTHPREDEYATLVCKEIETNFNKACDALPLDHPRRQEFLLFLKEKITFLHEIIASNDDNNADLWEEVEGSIEDKMEEIRQLSSPRTSLS